MATTDLPKCLQKYADKIAEVSDERTPHDRHDRVGDGYWVYLKEGWREPDGETHAIHEDNPRDCARLMKWVVPCTDPKCCRPVAAH